MAEVLLTVTSLGLGILAPWLVVRWDERRLDDAMLERGWNEASFWSAIVAFGPIAVWVHFAKTRRSLSGVLLGFFSATLTTTAIVGVTSGLAWLLGVD